MRIRGILLGTIEEQMAGGDTEPIDPNAFNVLQMKGPDIAPVTVEFDHQRTVGRVTKLWQENGRLMFEAELDSLPEADRPVVGFSAERVKGNHVIHKANLFAIGLTLKPIPHDQPPFTVIEEPNQ